MTMSSGEVLTAPVLSSYTPAIQSRCSGQETRHDVKYCMYHGLAKVKQAITGARLLTSGVEVEAACSWRGSKEGIQRDKAVLNSCLGIIDSHCLHRPTCEFPMSLP